MVAAEPVCIFRREPFHERSGGVHFFRGVCTFERFPGKEKIGAVTPRLRSNFRCRIRGCTYYHIVEQIAVLSKNEIRIRIIVDTKLCSPLPDKSSIREVLTNCFANSFLYLFF